MTPEFARYLLRKHSHEKLAFVGTMMAGAGLAKLLGMGAGAAAKAGFAGKAAAGVAGGVGAMRATGAVAGAAGRGALGLGKRMVKGTGRLYMNAAEKSPFWGGIGIPAMAVMGTPSLSDAMGGPKARAAQLEARQMIQNNAAYAPGASRLE